MKTCLSPFSLSSAIKDIEGFYNNENLSQIANQVGQQEMMNEVIDETILKYNLGVGAHEYSQASPGPGVVDNNEEYVTDVHHQDNLIQTGHW